MPRSGFGFEIELAALIVANNTVIASELPREGALEPFAHSGFGALVFAAAADAPDAILLADDDGDVTAGEIARRTRLVVAHLRSAGVSPGERVLIVAGAQVGAVVALAAVLRLGAEPALAPCGGTIMDLAGCARMVGAVAIIGPARYGDLEFGEAYLSAASIVDTVRVIATQGPGPVDGAVDLSPTALSSLPAAARDDSLSPESPVVVTFRAGSSAPAPILHRQAALFADALSLCEQARINPSKRIISTLPPATLAGLVAGPFAALVGASSLALHGPFDAGRFLKLLDAQPGSHLVAPCATGGIFEDDQLSAEVASLILVSRFADTHSFSLPPSLRYERQIVDLYAFGEDTLLARSRTGGEARPPARVTDKSNGGGLGAKLNRARAEIAVRGSDSGR